MAKVVYKSAGVTAEEAGTTLVPLASLSSTPAIVIGTSQIGPAFSPLFFTKKGDFNSIFGIPYVTGSAITPDDRYTSYGPLAVEQWLLNPNAGAVGFIRVLGTGDGKTRIQSGNNAGDVNNAGFTVGEEQPEYLTSSGALGKNPYANANGVLGRTYFLGCFMSESIGSTIFSSAKIQGTGSVNGIVNQSIPIIRGILMAPSGVVLRLSSSGGGYDSSAPSSTLVGSDLNAKGTTLGSVKLFDPGNNQISQEFVLLLNGHKGTEEYPNVITASFDIQSPNYITKVFNVTASLIQKAGHYLAAHWDIHSTTAILTGTGVVTAGANLPDDANRIFSTERSVFIITSSLARNVGSSTVPNYENFRDRFSNASSPWIISQKFQGVPINLFKLHSLHSGDGIANKHKFIISNILPAEKDASYPYGTFDLSIRNIYDNLETTTEIEKFVNLTLDPTSPRYISKVIGDKHAYFDFDRVENEQRLVVEGNYDNRSNYIRVEVSQDVEDNKIPFTALPFGFRGMSHIITSGSSPLAGLSSSDSLALISNTFLRNSIVPPIPFTDTISIKNEKNELVVVNNRRWGIRFDHITDLSNQNLNTIMFNKSIDSFVKHFPYHSINDINFSAVEKVGYADTQQLGIVDNDRFNNNLFTLENIKVVTGSVDPKLSDDLISENWAKATYVRDGIISVNDEESSRRLQINDLYDDANLSYLSFQFVLQGGFDGVNIFNKDEYNICNIAATADIENSNRGKLSGATVSSYLSALKVVNSPSTVDMQILAIPGIREPVITNAAVEVVEERFDSLYLMDIEQLNKNEDLIDISILQANDNSLIPDTRLTTNRFTSRHVNSTFAAAYFPDVVLEVDNNRYQTTNSVSVPPSVAVLGAFSLNDTIGQPWYAPAGTNRGALNETLTTLVKLDEEKRNLLYSGSINPIYSPKNAEGQASGVIISGQKTLGSKNSLLSRISVRRLLLQIRREIRDIATRILFTSDRNSMIEVLQGQISRQLESIQINNGLREYRVDIDSSMTSVNDIENGIVRARVYIRPLGTDEFASVDVSVGTGGGSEV